VADDVRGVTADICGYACVAILAAYYHAIRTRGHTTLPLLCLWCGIAYVMVNSKWRGEKTPAAPLRAHGLTLTNVCRGCHTVWPWL